MTISIYRYTNETGLYISEDEADLSSLSPEELQKRSETVWIDIESDRPELVAAVAERFKFHELTVEDCLDAEHSPKLDDFANYLFMIFRDLRPLPRMNSEENPFREMLEQLDEVRYTRGLALYLGRNYLITHRIEEVPWLDALLRQVAQMPEQTIADGADMMAHRVLDVLVDRFTRSLSGFEEVIDTLEDEALEHPENFELKGVVGLKRKLSSLRQVMREHKIAISRLAYEGGLIREERVRRYFRDVEDHTTAAIKQLDKQIDMLVGIRDVHFALANVRLGDIMRVLAIITTIGMPLHLIVGIYGMNFASMPLLQSPQGFWLVLCVMLGLIISMLFLFRHKRWI